MSFPPAHDPEFADFAAKPAQKRPLGVGRILLILGIGALVVMFFLPAVRTAPKARDRLRCAFNLRQIVIALRGYEQAYGCLPPACTVDAGGRPLHSWRTLILPYLDERELYASIDLARPWDDPANAKALQTSVSTYHCRKLSGPRNTTTYLAVVAPGGCFLPTQARRMAEITDARGSTLMLIEAGVGNAFPWMKPADADEALVMRLGRDRVEDLNHAGGFNACFVDDNVKFLGADLSPETRRALISIAGRDFVDPQSLGD